MTVDWNPDEETLGICAGFVVILVKNKQLLSIWVLFNLKNYYEWKKCE